MNGIKKGMDEEGTGPRSRGRSGPGREGNRGWRVVQPGSMCDGEGESQTARHARFVSADLDLGQDRPPAITGVRSLRRDRSPPRSCDASRARPSSGGDAQRYSRACSRCQEQSENIALARTVTAGLVPAIHVLRTTAVQRCGSGNKSEDETLRIPKCSTIIMRSSRTATSRRRVQRALDPPWRRSLKRSP
jgi:hypothetical protein